jgi:hypothetical protein
MKSKCLVISVLVALAGFLPQSKASLTLVTLGSAGSFGVLGGSAVTSTGHTVVNGNVGVSPGTAITGLSSGTVNGTIHNADGVAAQAHADALTAYNTLAGETFTQNLTDQDLGTLTPLLPGVYKFNSSAQLTGTLTLSGTGDFIFQIGSTLTTASGSSIVLISGAQANNVFWQVGSSATLGKTTSFVGNILADTSITLGTGASLSGRALALNAAVTLDDNVITAVPEPSTLISGALLLLPFGASLCRILRRNQTA